MTNRYDLAVTNTAKKDITKLSLPVARRIKSKLMHFISQDDPLCFAKVLHRAPVGSHRWRVGDYRILIEVEGTTIYVLRIRHRRESYSAKRR